MTDNKKRKVRSLKAVKAKYLESHPKIREWIEFTIDDGGLYGLGAGMVESVRLPALNEN